MMERLNVKEPTFQLCEAFGFDPKNVARIDLTPSTAAVTVYRLNAEGKKHIDPETQEAAQEQHDFLIRTWDPSE